MRGGERDGERESESEGQMKIFEALEGTKLLQNVILDGSLNLTGQSVI